MVALFASDHVITKQDEFLAVCARAAAAAEKGFIVTLGVKPTEPAIGYGYIRPGEAIAGTEAIRVEAFVEKPKREVAESYVAAGYLWNSGNFFFRADVMLEELSAFEPEMAEAAAARRSTAPSATSASSPWTPRRSSARRKSRSTMR